MKSICKIIGITAAIMFCVLFNHNTSSVVYALACHPLLSIDLHNVYDNAVDTGENIPETFCIGDIEILSYMIQQSIQLTDGDRLQCLKSISDGKKEARFFAVSA